MLPHDLPPYTTVYGYFQKWQRKGIWQLIHDCVRHQLRQDLGRDEQSTVAIADAQSVKTVERTFGWLNRFRRLSKDYELYTEVSEAMIYGSLIRQVD
jgi:transposase